MVNPSPKCENCGEPLSPGSRFCENCRHPVAPETGKAEKKPVFSRITTLHLMAAMVVIGLLIVSLAVVLYYNPFDQRQAIEIKAAQGPTITECNNKMRIGDYLEAVACYDKVINSSPNSDEAYYNKGMSIMKMEPAYINKKASESFKGAYERNSTSEEALIKQGLCLYYGLITLVP